MRGGLIIAGPARGWPRALGSIAEAAGRARILADGTGWRSGSLPLALRGPRLMTGSLRQCERNIVSTILMEI